MRARHCWRSCCFACFICFLFLGFQTFECISFTGIQSLSFIFQLFFFGGGRENEKGISNAAYVLHNNKKRTTPKSVNMTTTKNVWTDKNGFGRNHGTHNNNLNNLTSRAPWNTVLDARRYCSEQKQQKVFTFGNNELPSSWDAECVNTNEKRRTAAATPVAPVAAAALVTHAATIYGCKRVNRFGYIMWINLFHRKTYGNRWTQSYCNSVEVTNLAPLTELWFVDDIFFSSNVWRTILENLTEIVTENRYLSVILSCVPFISNAIHLQQLVRCLQFLSTREFRVTSLLNTVPDSKLECVQ